MRIYKEVDFDIEAEDVISFLDDCNRVTFVEIISSCRHGSPLASTGMGEKEHLDDVIAGEIFAEARQKYNITELQKRLSA